MRAAAYNLGVAIMCVQPCLIVQGQWATLTNAPATATGTPFLDTCLAFPDPDRKHKAAFREGRWDGLVRLYTGDQFPAGLARSVAAALEKQGAAPRWLFLARKQRTLDLSRFSANYLIGKTLYEHQYDAVRVALEIIADGQQFHGMTIRVPTGGGKTLLIAALAKYLWEEWGVRSLVMTGRKGLARKNAAEFRKLTDLEVGQCGDGEKTFGVITSATAGTLLGYRPRTRWNKRRRAMDFIPADARLIQLLRDCQALFVDECAHLPAASWYDIAMACSASVRIGFSATPPVDKPGEDRLSESETLAAARLVGATGPIVYDIPADVLIDRGLLRRPKIAMVMHPAACEDRLPTEAATKLVDGRWVNYQRRLPYAEAYVRGIVESRKHNAWVVRSARWMVQHGRRVLVLCRRKDQFLYLCKCFQQYAVRFVGLWGDTDTEVRDQAKVAFAAGDYDVIVATAVLEEGEDIPAIDGLVFAEGVKKASAAIQRVGRGMRRGATPDVWVADNVPLGHDTLTEHALSRCEAWEGEGYETRVVEQWPEGDDLSDDLLPFLTWT